MTFLLFKTYYFIFYEWNRRERKLKEFKNNKMIDYLDQLYWDIKEGKEYWVHDKISVEAHPFPFHITAIITLLMYYFYLDQ